MPQRRRWLYRVLGLLVVPVLVLASAEVILRVVGYGHSGRFFLPASQGDTEVVIANRDFGLLFFPPTLTRHPPTIRFPRVKPTNTYRIFLLGESAALGDPRPAYGMGRYLEVLLEERYPQQRFEVIPAAMTAINSHGLRRIAAECCRYDADLWIVYMGNNEMAGPFGAVTVFGPPAPSRLYVRARLTLKSSRLGQALESLVRRLRPAPALPERWGGLDMFSDRSLAPDAVARQQVHGHFRANLRDIVHAGLRCDADVLLCTVAVNLADCPPFASAHSAGHSADATNRWSAALEAARATYLTGDHSAALEQLRSLEADDPAFADVRYLQGLCALALTNQPRTLEHLTAARDTDALPFRTDSVLNAIIREAAGETARRGVGLVDFEAAMTTERPRGHDLFLDHVHFNLEGNEWVARRLAREIEKLLPADMQEQAAPEWATSETLERRLGLTDWNRVAMYETMLQRFLEPPYTRQWNHNARLESFARRISELRKALHPRFFVDAEDLYAEAIRRDPSDPRLHENFAQFLEATGNLEGALSEWTHIAELERHPDLAWFQRGRLLSKLRRYEEARTAFDRSLELQPDLEEARLEIARMLFEQGKHQESLEVCAELRRRQPRNARVLRYLADPLAALGRRVEAMDCLREAVQLQPDYWEARYLLGVELGVENQLEAARAEFETVARLRPDFVLGRLNLGVVYARLGRFEDARAQFLEVLRLEPGNPKAQQHLDSLASLLEARPSP